MNVTHLTNGRTFVTLGLPVDYQSPLWITSSTETEVVYSESKDSAPVARVYRKDGEWYLATGYLSHWQPDPTLTKYDGFLLLLRLYKGQKEGE
jgi:hypothetical protein